MNQQISNYIRGKVLEIVIVGTVSYITFAILDLRYSVLLAVVSRAFGIDPLYRRCSCNRTCCDCGLVPMGADPAVLHLVDCLRHYSGFGR